MRTDPIDAGVKKAIEDIVRAEVEAFGMTSVHVSAGSDHDGDPALFVDVVYEDGGKPIDTAVLTRLVSKVHSRTWEMGEERFPYIRHHFDERQKVVGYR